MGRRKLNEFDIQAEREAKALSDLCRMRPKNQQLRKSYVCDGFRFPTGQKHRNVIQTAC